MIRQKITESQNCSSSRGPGRPPVMDLIDDCDDIDDPVSTFFCVFCYYFYFLYKVPCQNIKKVL